MKGLSLEEHFNEASLFVTHRKTEQNSTRFSINKNKPDSKISSVEDLYDRLDPSEVRDSTMIYDKNHMNDYKANFEKVMGDLKDMSKNEKDKNSDNISHSPTFN